MNTANMSVKKIALSDLKEDLKAARKERRVAIRDENYELVSEIDDTIRSLVICIKEVEHECDKS